MKKSFTLLEIIIVVLLISLISTFVYSSFSGVSKESNLIKLKSDLAFIRTQISKKINQNILLSKNEDIVLDEAKIDTKDESLFSNVVDLNIMATTSQSNEIGKWIKSSQNRYDFIYDDSKTISFEFKENKFLCISSNELCSKVQ